MSSCTVAATRLQRSRLSTGFSLALAVVSALVTDSAQAHFVSEPAATPRSIRRHAVPFIPSRPAGIIQVANCNDSGPGSLRDAVASTVDGDEVDLSHLACSTISLTTGYLEIDANISLQGPGADQLTITTGGDFSVIEHFGSGVLDIGDLTIANGKYVSAQFPYGGCIYSTGSVSILASVVSGCTVNNTTSSNNVSKGGAVFALGDVTLFSSTITGSAAISGANVNAEGGGIYARGRVASKYSTVSNNSAAATVAGFNSYAGGVWAHGDATILYSTISGNMAQSDAGLVLVGANATSPMTISESTISENDSSDSYYGSGLFAGNAISITNSTITGNVAANPANQKYGAGVCLGYGVSADIESSIVAGNLIAFTTGGTLADDIEGRSGAVLTGGNNIVNSTLLILPDTLNVDPMLGPLADNGGPTMTHALLPGSPAINAGNNVAMNANDQRGPGYTRIVGDEADIGAIEYTVAADTIFADGFESPN